MLKGIIKLFKPKNNGSKQPETYSPDIVKIHEKFISELLYDPLPEWDRISLRFEYYPWKEDHFRVFSLKRHLKNDEEKFDLTLEAIDVLIELSELMAQNSKDSWTWLTFNLHSSGKYEFDFKYDIPPRVKEMLTNAGEIQ